MASVQAVKSASKHCKAVVRDSPRKQSLRAATEQQACIECSRHVVLTSTLVCLSELVIMLHQQFVQYLANM